MGLNKCVRNEQNVGNRRQCDKTYISAIQKMESFISPVQDAQGSQQEGVKLPAHKATRTNEAQPKLGDRIRALRRQFGWSQEQFAEVYGLHRTYMGHVERGEKMSRSEIRTIVDKKQSAISFDSARVGRPKGEVRAIRQSVRSNEFLHFTRKGLHCRSGCREFNVTRACSRSVKAGSTESASESVKRQIISMISACRPSK